MNLPRSTYPSLNMHFAVEFDSKRFKADRNFQSVQGIKARICENEVKKGTHVQFENIILRRAYLPDSLLVKWCMDAINNQKKQPLSFTVKLLNANEDMLCGWEIENALPISWGIEELHSQDAKILIEIIELSYQRFQVLNSKGNNIAPGIPIFKK